MDFRCDQTLGPERVYDHFLSMIPIGGFALVPNLAKTVSVPICILIFLFLHIVQHRYSYIEPGLPVIKK